MNKSYVQTVRNVNQAYHNLRVISQQPEHWRAITVRGQHTIEWEGTFITEYLRPRERVLFDPVRDCNHFFHFFESLWILAGRKDVGYLAQFNKNMEQFSDDGISFHGAYGYRLRLQQDMDQLREVIKLLRQDPNTRRAVLQIWDAGLDLNASSKDIPCNDLLMFKVRNGEMNMTICCRSNDAMWGAYGANAVHFSVLHEFVAHACGFEVGAMVQVSDSFHLYDERSDFKKMEATNNYPDYYTDNGLRVVPFEIMPIAGTNGDMTSDEWLIQLDHFMRGRLFDYHGEIDMFFSEVAAPMLRAWNAYKGREELSKPDLSKNERIEAAKVLLKGCAAEDWKIACVEWLERRKERE